MPYSKTHYFMLLILIITVVAFWPSYFGRLNDAPLAHHLHGATSTLWILLIAWQSWLIHNGRRAAHRKAGLLIFVMVPLMTAAFALVTWAGAQKAVADHPFYVLFGQALLTADVWLMCSTALQVYLAMRWRRLVHIHSALIIGTLIGLLPPILSRLFANYLPGMMIEGPDTLYRFEYAIQLSMLLSVLLGIGLAVLYRKSRWPWLMAAGIAAISYGLYATVGQTNWWAAVVMHLSQLHPGTIYLSGLLLGILAVVFGWRHGLTAHSPQG
ncbi:hypothetical protein ACFODZ_15810 [Marinicella sediminis]|uniref:Uncharacterized protein n=1 Tax=Marinicella sediminis TaxID=1792834 RepID=A0ABV7JCC2_9GAMM|nr:hypothetical protein [Marinicella sediminis]